MSEKKHLHILWTNADLITTEKMVFMYSTNSLIQGWWEQVTVIIWGAPAKLVAQNSNVQRMLQEAQEAGVHITACKACGDQLGVTEKLKELEERKTIL